MNTLVPRANIHAVVVTFEPDQAVVEILLRALLAQVRRVNVVDNSIAGGSALESIIGRFATERIHLHRMDGNSGVAAALNIGIGLARDAGATHVLLSDQDSEPATDMVARLLESHDELCARDDNVGAVGPTFTDKYTGVAFPFQARIPGKFFYGHARADADTPFVEALSLITSGCLIPMDVLDDVGGMREDLFIDKVDIEWCHRARARGWKLFGIGTATMLQRMGDADLSVWYFGWRRESVYSPLRLYYQSRNFVALAREPWIDWRWKVRNAWYTLGVIYSQVVFGKSRGQSLSKALRGLTDGLRGRMGPYRAR